MARVMYKLAEEASRNQEDRRARIAEEAAKLGADEVQVVKSGFKKVFKSFELPSTVQEIQGKTTRPLRKRRIAEPGTIRRRKHQPGNIGGAGDAVRRLLPLASAVASSSPSSISQTSATPSITGPSVSPMLDTISTSSLVDTGPINPLIPISVAMMILLGMLVFGVIICGLVRHRRHRLHCPEEGYDRDRSLTTPDAEKRSRAVRRSSTLTSFNDQIIEHPGTSSTPRVQVTPSTPTRQPRTSSILGPPLPVIPGRRVAFAAPSTPEYYTPQHTSWTPDSPQQWEHPQIWSNRMQDREHEWETSLETISEEPQILPRSYPPLPVHALVEEQGERREAYDGFESSSSEGHEVPYIDRFSIHSTSSDDSTGSSSYTTASSRMSMPETPVHSQFSGFGTTGGAGEAGSPIKTAIMVHPAPRRARSHTIVTLDEQAHAQIGVRMSQVARVEQEIAALEDLLSSESGLFLHQVLEEVGEDDEYPGEQYEGEAEEAAGGSPSLDSIDQLDPPSVLDRPETRCEMLPPLNFQLPPSDQQVMIDQSLMQSPSRVARANTFPAKLLARRFSLVATRTPQSCSSPPAVPTVMQRRKSMGSAPSTSTSAELLFPPLNKSLLRVGERPPAKEEIQVPGKGTLAPSISQRFSACSCDEYLDSLDLYHRGTEMQGADPEESMEERERRRLTIKSLDLAKFPMPDLPSIRVTSH